MSFLFSKMRGEMPFLYQKYQEMLCFLGPRFPKFITKWQYHRLFGEKLNLKHPRKFSEKIQWLKLYNYNDNPLVIQCADKYRVREYIEKCNCPEILNKLYAVYQDVNEINWDTLPSAFVIKLNTASGYNLICRNKKNLDSEESKCKIRQWFKSPKGEKTVELHYTKIKPLLVCERYIPTIDTVFPVDYKIFCCHGEAQYCILYLERDKGIKRIALDKNYSVIQGVIKDEYATLNYPLKPFYYKKMIEYAERLSKPFPFVRMDFYIDNEKIIFGEMTFTPGGGYNVYFTDGANLQLGAKIHLPID